MKDTFNADAIVVGHGLAGLVTAYEITKAGKKVILVDQESENNIGVRLFGRLEGCFLSIRRSSD